MIISVSGSTFETSAMFVAEPVVGDILRRVHHLGVVPDHCSPGKHSVTVGHHRGHVEDKPGENIEIIDVATIHNDGGGDDDDEMIAITWLPSRPPSVRCCSGQSWSGELLDTLRSPRHLLWSLDLVPWKIF